MRATTITLVVLSESEIPEAMDIGGIIEECDVGDYVMHSILIKSKPITDEQMARALIEAGSDPGFFLLEHVDLGT